MFSVFTNIYNKKTKGPTLMQLFTATGKVKKFFFFFGHLEMFDVCNTGDTSNIPSCQKKFSFPVAVKNSIKVGPLVFLL